MTSVWYAIKTKLAYNSAFVSKSFPSTAPFGSGDDDDDQSLQNNPQHTTTTTTMMKGDEEVSGAGDGGAKRKASELSTFANADLDYLIDPSLRNFSMIPPIPEGDAAPDTGDDDDIPAKKAKKARATKTPASKKKAGKKPAAKKPAVKEDTDAKNKKKVKLEEHKTGEEQIVGLGINPGGT